MFEGEVKPVKDKADGEVLSNSNSKKEEKEKKGRSLKNELKNERLKNIQEIYYS